MPGKRKPGLTGLEHWQLSAAAAPAAAAAPTIARVTTAEPAQLVKCTLSLTVEQHRRVVELALSTPGTRKRRATIQDLALAGLNGLFLARGLPPLITPED